MKNNKGFTLVEVLVSFSLTMVIIIYLLNVINSTIKRENELSVLKSYSVFEAKLLNKIYNDIDEYVNENTKSQVSITEYNNSLVINGINKKLIFDKINNIIIYDGTNYNLPDGVSFDDKIYELKSGVYGNNYYVAKINLKVSNNIKNIKIIYQYKD